MPMRLESKHSFKSVIFDLDGVITKTALTHARAWKEVFDEYLRLRAKRGAEPFREFTHDDDYLPYVDGKPRYDGVKSFLKSRGIEIPFGDPADSEDKESICGLGNKKNVIFQDILRQEGSETYPSSITLIEKLQKAGIRIGLATSSKNCQFILESAGITELFETKVDGVVSTQLGLKGKPEGDIFVTAAGNVGTKPADSVVVEDATSGVQAGRNGGFGLVLGVARKDNQSELLEHGADAVVNDLEQIDINWIERWFRRQPRPLFKSWESAKEKNAKGKIIINPCYMTAAKEAMLNKKRLIFFLDYDGTLTPIVKRPELAIMSSQMRQVVSALSKRHTVAIVSGRMRQDVEQLVDIKGLFYAGSHGFDIKGPGFSMIHPRAQEIEPIISQLITQFKQELKEIPGVLVEEKKFSVAVHYRLVDEKKYLARIKDTVDKVVGVDKSLRILSGKKVFEVLPDIAWDKGKAIRWILEALELSWSETSVIYIGDDVTDEDAFRMIRTRGNGILVSDKPKVSCADFYLSSTAQVKDLFARIARSAQK